MKKNITLSIPSSCSAKWASFTPVALGGFCHTCNKTVIDFTEMTDEQVFAFFVNNASHTCGRFRPGQLKEYGVMPMVKVRPGISLVKAGLLSLLLLLINRQLPAQDVHEKAKTETVQHTPGRNVVKGFPKTIQGVIKDEYKDPLPGVNVVLKGTEQGTVTDGDGRFELRADFEKHDVIIFSFIGYVPTEYKIKVDEGDVVEIMMNMEADITGEVAVADVYGPKPTGFWKIWEKIKNVF